MVEEWECGVPLEPVGTVVEADSKEQARKDAREDMRQWIGEMAEGRRTGRGPDPATAFVDMNIRVGRGEVECHKL